MAAVLSEHISLPFFNVLVGFAKCGWSDSLAHAYRLVWTGSSGASPSIEVFRATPCIKFRQNNHEQKIFSSIYSYTYFCLVFVQSIQYQGLIREGWNGVLRKKSHLTACANSNYSDQLAHPRKLNRVLPVRCIDSVGFIGRLNLISLRLSRLICDLHEATSKIRKVTSRVNVL